jgi:hypothetical protein
VKHIKTLRPFQFLKNRRKVGEKVPISSNAISQ